VIDESDMKREWNIPCDHQAKLTDSKGNGIEDKNNYI